MNIKIYPNESVRDIEDRILRFCQLKLNTVFQQAEPAINRRVREAIESLISGTTEYKSLLGGELMGEFGISNPVSRLSRILAVLKNSISITHMPIVIRAGQLIGGFKVEMIKGDLSDILGIPEASYVSSPSGETIPWLEWLTKGGDQILVFSHEIYYDLDASAKLRSRSGMALMRPGAGWRVPPEFAGTEGSNFITRAFDGEAVEKLLATIIREEVEGRL